MLESVKSATKKIARTVLPRDVFEFGKRVWRGSGHPPAVGRANFGDLRRVTPISRGYGYERGRPIDRYYIENFLERESQHISGRVLEIGESTYTRKFGRGVTHIDVLHVSESCEEATYVDDLATGEALPSGAFDCVILTQTLHLIYDMKAALATIYRILRPGGVLLATVPGISQISDDEWNPTWYWSLTTNSAKRVFEEVFPPGNVDVASFGNVLAASSFLHGFADSELTRKELDFFDPEYPVTVTIKARTADHGLRVPMADRWDYAGKEPFAYDEETSYRKGLEFLDGHGVVEDWGCGTAFAKRFLKSSVYVGIDSSASDYVDVKVDLQEYRSQADCVFMRHVLEHNWGWRSILRNAVASFRRRMVLVVFTPFDERETKLKSLDGIPDLALDKAEVLSHFDGLAVREEKLASDTEYGEETIFYVERTANGGSVPAAD